MINTVSGTEFGTHNFAVSQGGIYGAIITDLNVIDKGFFDPFATLAMKITDGPVTTLSGPVGNPGGAAFVDFTASEAGSFAALVKATSGPGGSGYQVRVAPIHKPAVWVMLAAGFGLLGFVRIRRAAHNGI